MDTPRMLLFCFLVFVFVALSQLMLVTLNHSKVPQGHTWMGFPQICHVLLLQQLHSTPITPPTNTCQWGAALIAQRLCYRYAASSHTHDPVLVHTIEEIGVALGWESVQFEDVQQVIVLTMRVSADREL